MGAIAMATCMLDPPRVRPDGFPGWLLCFSSQASIVADLAVRAQLAREIDRS